MLKQGTLLFFDDYLIVHLMKCFMILKPQFQQMKPLIRNCIHLFYIEDYLIWNIQISIILDPLNQYDIYIPFLILLSLYLLHLNHESIDQLRFIVH